MCQNHNTQKTSQIKGSILLTSNRIPVFMPGLHIKENSNSIITSWASFGGFQRFCRYAAQLGLFSVNNGNQADCDFATLKALYIEFEEMEQNQSLTAILFRNNIFPETPKVNALNCGSGKPRFNFWLEKCRRMLKIGVRRLLFPIIVTGN
jgi:hypothetical protein